MLSHLNNYDTKQKSQQRKRIQKVCVLPFTSVLVTALNSVNPSDGSNWTGSGWVGTGACCRGAASEAVLVFVLSV